MMNTMKTKRFEDFVNNRLNESNERKSYDEMSDAEKVAHLEACFDIVELAAGIDKDDCSSLHNEALDWKIPGRVDEAIKDAESWYREIGEVTDISGVLSKAEVYIGKYGLEKAFNEFNWGELRRDFDFDDIFSQEWFDEDSIGIDIDFEGGSGSITEAYSYEGAISEFEDMLYRKRKERLSEEPYDDEDSYESYAEELIGFFKDFFKPEDSKEILGEIESGSPDFYEWLENKYNLDSFLERQEKFGGQEEIDL